MQKKAILYQKIVHFLNNPRKQAKIYFLVIALNVSINLTFIIRVNHPGGPYFTLLVCFKY